jgi:PAS domain S-box-containing protein
MMEAVERTLRHAHEASQLETQIRFVADHVPALMVYCDAQQRYKFVNTPYAERYGFAPDAVVGKLIREVIGEAAHERLRPHLEAVLSGERVEFEQRIDYERIGPRWVHCIYVPEAQPDGAITGFFAIVQDVTDRKATEDSLRESERRFRHMADHAPVVVWVSDADGACSYMSRNWYEFTGQEPDGALGLGWLAAVHPGDHARCWQTIQAAKNALEPFELDYRLRRKDGEYRWAIDSAVPRFGESGEFMGYIGSVVDITERKQMEEALRRADRHKDEFLATLSHELRNPLAPLRTTVDLLRMNAQRDEPPNSSVLDIMERQVVHLVRLVDDLLETSRISRGAFELRQERVELASVVRHAVETNEPLMKAAGHALRVTLPPEPLWLDGDPVRLAQILGNLLNNAAKYTAAGGRVSLEARRAGTFVEICVRDNGAGISAEALPQLFEMFTRGPDVLEGGQDGLGIGLALARRLVEMHGGRIRARSEGPGLGSEFEVRLPLSGQPKAVSTAT